MRFSQFYVFAAVSACWALAPASVVCADIQVIYSEIVASPTSIAPGMLDLKGNPVVGRFNQLRDINLSHDGSEWVLYAQTDLPNTHALVLLLGSGVTGSPLAQEGRPVPGSTTGELYEFFDSPFPAAWNEKGDLAFSSRARPTSSIKEKVHIFSNGTYTLVHHESQPVTGLIDTGAAGFPTGDELLGNSINSVHLLNSGIVGYTNTPIENCHSTRYPAFFHGTASFKQSGVSTVITPAGTEVWDSMNASGIFGGCGGTPDGLHYYMVGDTENPDTNLDEILAIDGEAVMRENTVIEGTTVTMADVLFVRMLANGDWYARGDDPSNNVWAIRNSVLLAKTGDPVISGPAPEGTENWGTTFTAFNGNVSGDWVLAGSTDNADPDLNAVLVLNLAGGGAEVILRESDPVDLDGDGKFDDGVFVNSFAPNDLHITNTGVIYVIITLKNEAGTDLGDAYLRIDLAVPCPADLNGDDTIDVNDLLLLIGAWGSTGPTGDINGDDLVDVNDLLLLIGAWGDC